MNAPDPFLTLNLGEAEVRVPREAAVLAYLQQLVEQRRTVDLASIPGARIAFQRDCAHDVGEHTKDGVYAGLSIHDNRAVELYLLPGESDEISWPDAVKWAETVAGGQLPSRMDQLVLLKNLKPEFKEEAYWSGEQTADERWAWYQYFRNGTPVLRRSKDNELRARAVRRVAI
jgi:hypothetical protein